MWERPSGNELGVPHSKRNFPLSRGPCMVLFSLLLILIAGLASEAEEARSQIPEPDPSPPANARYIPPSELWPAVDYTEDGWPIVADELIVKFRDSVAEEARESILGQAEARSKDIYEYSDIRVVKVDPAERERILKELSSNEDIEIVEPNPIAQPDTPPRLEPDDYDPDYLWHLENIQAPEGWYITQGSPSKAIAILDSGVDYTHPDLDGKVVPGWDFISGDPDPMDESGHGTWVAGAAAATTDNGEGIAAVAWQPKILAMRTGGVGEMAQALGLAAALDVDVINISLSWDPHVETFYEALVDAVGQGIIVVSSNSNETGPCEMAYPQSYHEVIAVSSVHRTDEYDQGCTTGAPTPSGDSKNGPDVVAPTGVPTTVLGGGYQGVGGTSIATAIVSGAAAMMLSCTPDAEFVKHAIASTADDLGDPGFDEWTGWGRINLYNALSEACLPAPTINIKATPNPLLTPGSPVAIEISAFDSDSDLAQVRYVIEGNSSYVWDDLVPGVSPNCSSSSCRTILTLNDFTKPNYRYRMIGEAWDQAGNLRVFCAYNCPDNDVALGDNNYYYLEVGDGSASSSPDMAVQSVEPHLAEPMASVGSTVRVDLDWTDTEGESGFAIQKRVGTGLFADFATVPAGITDYSDTLPSSQEGETLTYRVRARFPDTSSSLSNEGSIDAPTSPDDPTSSPLDVTIYCTGWGEIGIFTPWARLEWDAKSGYTGQYKVQHKKSSGTWTTQLTGGTDFNIPLDNNSAYQFKVLLADSTPWTGPETRSVSCEDPEPPEPGSGNLTGSSYCDPHVSLEHLVVVSLDWDEYLPDSRYCVEIKYPGDLFFHTVECRYNPWLITKYDGTGYIRDNTETGWQVVIPDYGGDILWGGPIYITTPPCKSDVVDLSLQVLPVDGSSRIEPGEDVEAKIWLKNNSSKIARVGPGNPFKINLWADRADAPSFGDQDHDAQTATTLAPYEEKQFTMSFTAPATVGSNKRGWVLGDGYDQVMEIFEDNNRLAAYYTVSAPPPPCDSFGDVDDDGYVTPIDIDIISEGSLTDEQKLKADIDGDGEVTQADIDGITDYLDGLAYTVPVCEDLDDDGLPNYQDDDDDNDEFEDAVELYLPTDPLDNCTDEIGVHDAWPLDINMDRAITVTGDVLNFRDHIGAAPGSPEWWQRLDLNMDGAITVAGDALFFRGMIGESCI